MAENVEAVRGSIWTAAEVDSIVIAYFQMLRLEVAGETYIKKDFIKREMGVAGRSRGSIEFKFQNVSAVLLEHGLPYINGYKPTANYQALLAATVERTLADQIEKIASASLERNQWVPPKIVPIPQAILRGASTKTGAARRVDWASTENRQRALGRKGEAYVLELERRTLAGSGRPDLAQKIIWSSEVQGDGLGFDIQSFSPDGQELYIEVKTTIGGADTPFFLTPNEIAASAHHHEQFRLYRLFDFIHTPKLYVLEGELSDCCRLAPSEYLAFPKSGTS